MYERAFSALAWVTVALTLTVIVLSAGIRLDKAGIGCREWPACYGRIGEVEEGAKATGLASIAHRLVASTLAVTVLILNLLAAFGGRPKAGPLLLLGLTAFLAIIGVWSAGLERPAVVLGNVLGGMAMLAVAWRIAIRQRPRDASAAGPGQAVRGWALVGILVLGLQIALGALTSAEFAALACTRLPGCESPWWPPFAALRELTVFGLLPLGPESGVITGPGQAALHMLHRAGALVTLGYLTWLGMLSLRAGGWPRRVGVFLLALAWLQAGIGVASVAGGLPFALALAHNATAALLLLALVGLYVPGPMTWIQDRRGSAEGEIE